MLKKVCVLLICFIFLVNIVPWGEPLGMRKAEAATVNTSAISMRQNQRGTWSNVIEFEAMAQATQFEQGSLEATFPLSLPTGIRVTNATASMFVRIQGNRSGWQHIFSFMGRVWDFWSWWDGCSVSPNPEWVTQNVTGWLSHYNGGAQNVTMNFSLAYGAGFHSGAMASLFAQSHLSPNRPTLTVTYVFAPTTPTISSPVAGSRHMHSVALSASSTVTGGGTITYNWEYSTNGSTWIGIGSSPSILTWNIPTSIPTNTTIFLRVCAIANGVWSPYSSTITFIKGVDDLAAAKLAAEAALIAANQASARAQQAIDQTFFAGQTVAQIANEVRNNTVFNSPGNPNHGKTAAQLAMEAKTAAERDEISPTLDIEWNNRKTATTAATGTLHINATDNRTPVNSLAYEVRVNGAIVASGTNPPSSIQVPLGAGTGLRTVTVSVKDERDNTTQRQILIWRL